MSVDYCVCGGIDHEEHTCPWSATLNDYQDAAALTANPDLSREERTVVAALGLTGEAGECADIVKKAFGQGHKLNRGQLKRELGDVLWYVAEMATAQGWTLSEVATHNVAKLRHRYPEGFDSLRSIDRHSEGRPDPLPSQNTRPGATLRAGDVVLFSLEGTRHVGTRLCEDCAGEGCQLCGHKGTVRTTIQHED